MKLLPIVRRTGGNNYNLHTLVFAIVAYAMVDDQFYAHLMQFRWFLLPNGYPCRRERGKNVYLHKEVLVLAGVLTLDEGDHKDHNKLNAQLGNLRPATRSQNSANQVLKKNSSTKLKGVYWRRDMKKWQAQITFQGRTVHLGSFDDPKEAARVRDAEALKLFGPYALTNQALGLL